MADELVELTTTEFDAFALAHEQGSYLQTAAQAVLLRQRGWQTALLGMREAGKVVAAALVMWRPVKFGQFFQIDNGILMDWQNLQYVEKFVHGLRKFARQRGGLYLQVIPNIVGQTYDTTGQIQAINPLGLTLKNTLSQLGLQHQAPVAGWTTAASPQWQFMKLLPSSDSVPTYQKIVARHLKKAQRMGVMVRDLAQDELPAFQRVMHETAQRLSYHDKDLAFYQQAKSAFKDKLLFKVATLNLDGFLQQTQADIQQLTDQLQRVKVSQRDNITQQVIVAQGRLAKFQSLRNVYGGGEIIISGLLLFQTPNEMTFVFGGTLDDFQEFDASYLLQDSAIRQAIATAIPRYNFYGISGLFDGTDGVLMFKQRFIGEIQQKVGTFILPIQPLKFQLYRFLKRLLKR